MPLLTAIYGHRERNSPARFLITIIFTVIGVRFASAQSTREIQYDAENVEYDKNVANGAFRLWDNVVFTHEGARMYCDSAYYYPDRNSLDAYDNIHINQGDTLHLYGDIL